MGFCLGGFVQGDFVLIPIFTLVAEGSRGVTGILMGLV